MLDVVLEFANVILAFILFVAIYGYSKASEKKLEELERRINELNK